MGVFMHCFWICNKVHSPKFKSKERLRVRILDYFSCARPQVPAGQSVDVFLYPSLEHFAQVSRTAPGEPWVGGGSLEWGVDSLEDPKAI